MACAPGDQISCAALAGLLLAVGLFVGVFAVTVIRRRFLNVFADRKTPIEGKAAIATGAYLLGLMAACEVVAFNEIADNLWGASLPRGVLILLGIVIFGGVLFGAGAAISWAHRVRRRRQESGQR